jgi:guanylate kinase
MRKLGKRIIICGHGASGKDFLASKFVEKGFTKSISKTTRPMRSGEVPGLTYKFVSHNDFLNSVEKKEFFEYTNFNGWYYGTTNKSWNNSDIFIMTPRGVKNIPDNDREDCFIIFIDIPRDVRESRISERSDVDSITRRLLADDKDFKNFNDYNYRESNPNFNADNLVEIFANLNWLI